MRTCGQPGYVFQDFSLKQGIDFIIFCLKQGIDFIIFGLNQGINFINFCLKQGTFLNSFVIANGLNKKEFRYLLVSYTGYGFGLNVLTGYQKSEFCLKQGRKISDFCLKQGQGIRGRAAPPHPRIYRVPPPPGINGPSLYVLFSQIRPHDVLKGSSLLSFQNLCVHMHVHEDRTKFGRNCSLG